LNSATLAGGSSRRLALRSSRSLRFGGRFADLTAALARWRVEGFTVRLVVADELQAEHLRQILRDHDVEALVVPGTDAPEPLAIVVNRSNPMSEISLSDLRKLYRGQRSRWSNGRRVTLVMRPRPIALWLAVLVGACARPSYTASSGLW